MSRYLLAVEADKIQDLIFRSSRLREVVGGSQLLARFCAEVPRYLLPRYGGNIDRDIIIQDGGSFRILFDRKKDAEAFGEKLAEVYRLATRGVLTVAEPVEVNGDFGKASEEAEKNLRLAKRWRKDWQDLEQMPYMAFCASCGVGLAVAHQSYYENEKEQYLCVSCLNKSAERIEKSGSFLKPFYREVVGEAELALADWPGMEKQRYRLGKGIVEDVADDNDEAHDRPVTEKRDLPEDIADYDPRRYVAYLLADGNAMGEVFGKCRSPEQMRDLSKGLTKVIRQALAVPARKMMENNQLDDNSQSFIPVLPLIMAGDDLFALIPAPWALDFALYFCQEYETGMAVLLKDTGLNDVVPRPTVSAAVIICKYNHPYAQAHAAGEARLKEAKRLSKQWILTGGGQPLSAINFEVVLGGRLVDESPSSEIRATLRPYWVSGGGNDWGLPLQWLIEQRWELKSMSRKRLSDLKNLYDLNLPASLQSDEIKPWQVRLERLLQRIEQRSENQGPAVRKVLNELGGNEPGCWREVVRPPENIWYGHGLPDLLEAWNFALRLDKPCREYEGE